jgi:acetylornithine deacetylase/succinyl-diaminopimelate desuccinylase-like protein
MKFRPAFFTLLIVVIFALAAIDFSVSSSAQPDWEKATQESVTHLSNLIRIKTPQPEGNELVAARYLREVCEREGIESRIYESAPGRGNFVARLKGDGSARPILLMAHLDTVGVEPSLWTVDPFGGIVKDGYVWGRGAQDDKNIMAANLTAFLLLKRSGVKLRRDVILLGEADEEQGVGFGIEWMIKNHPAEIDAEFSLTEGGTSLLDADGKVRYFAIQTAEKVPVNIKVTTSGVSGHASVPRPDNPVVRLAKAIASIGAYETPVQFNETTRKFYEGLAAAASGEEKTLYESLLKAASARTPNQKLLKQYARQVAEKNLRLAALLRTTISPTVFNGGFQNNVIPGTAEANLNVRLLPFETPENLIMQLREAVNDPTVTFTALRMTRRPLAASSTDTELFRAFEKVIPQMSPGARVMPTMSTWATDSAQLRERGVQAYGVLWPKTPAEEAGFHGNDERIRISSLGYGTQVMWRVLMETAVKR